MAPVIEAATRHLQYPAHCRHATPGLVRLHECVLHDDSRAKYRAAFFKISFLLAQARVLALNYRQLSIGSTTTPLAGKRHVDVFGVDLVTPLVQPVARNAEFTSKISSRLLAQLQQAHGFQLEFSGKRLTLRHETPPQAVCAYLGVRETGGSSVCVFMALLDTGVFKYHTVRTAQMRLA